MIVLNKMRKFQDCRAQNYFDSHLNATILNNAENQQFKKKSSTKLSGCVCMRPECPFDNLTRIGGHRATVKKPERTLRRRRRGARELAPLDSRALMYYLYPQNTCCQEIREQVAVPWGERTASSARSPDQFCKRSAPPWAAVGSRGPG